MKKTFYPDFFNDVFGPIMQPGSSGGFAGTCRVGQTARAALVSPPKRVKILFNPSEHHLKELGTFMDDRGYLGGLQGFDVDDIRLFDAHELAREGRISYEFAELEQDNAYRGSVTFELTGTDGDTARLTAASVGGGMITTYEIHGFPICWRGDSHALLIWKEIEMGKTIEEEFKNIEKGICLQHLVEQSLWTREDKTKGFFLEFESEIAVSCIDELREQGFQVRYFPAVLPVVTIKDRKPQLFRSVEEWRKVAQQRGISFVQAAIEYEKNFSGWSEERIRNYFENIAEVLYHQVHSLEELGYENAVDTPMLPIYGKNWDNYVRNSEPVSDKLTRHILTHALATNAKLPGFKIVPAPMGTGGGYLFSALDAVREERGISHEKLIDSLIVAAGFGAIAYTRTNASGERGCVGESGVCCAMASAAVTWLLGGDAYQTEHAASMALQANIGIPCDPIPGGLEFPCITRTIRAAVTAPMYADIALAGIDPLIPYHEMLDLIEQTYRKTPSSFLCGMECGTNCTPAARRCHQYMQQEVMDGKLIYEAEE